MTTHVIYKGQEASEYQVSDGMNAAEYSKDQIENVMAAIKAQFEAEHPSVLWMPHLSEIWADVEIEIDPEAMVQALSETIEEFDIESFFSNGKE